MPRRKTRHKTGLRRIKGIGTKVHNAWVGYVCLSCKTPNYLSVGDKLLEPIETYYTAKWKCGNCGYIHSKDSPLPFKNWPSEYIDPSSIKCQRFWKAFFRISTESKESYFKQCNACGRILPFNAFDKHSVWGPLERQMECRSCKGAINAYLNPKRTKQQLLESNIKRRVADLLLEEKTRLLI